MENSFFLKEEYIRGFGRTLVEAEEVYEGFIKSGHKDYAFIQPDCYFISDKNEKIQALADLLKNNYGYTIREIKKDKARWAFNAESKEFPGDRDTLMFWAVDMYNKAYKFDCMPDGYGSLIEVKNPKFPIMDESIAEDYYNIGLEDYNNTNFSGAAINLNTAIKIKPKDPNYYYLRAMAKTDLGIWKSALRDYDECLKIAPDFGSALVNRGALKDDNGDYQGAIADYNEAIKIDPDDSMAYFNRGNTKFNLSDTEGACKDWHKAKELGAEYAQKRIDKNCK